MKNLALSLMLAAAIPAAALAQQTTDATPPTPPATQANQPPAPGGPDAVAPTPLSTSTAPSDGPRADQGQTPANDAAANAGGGMAPPPAPPPPPGATVVPVASPAPSEAFPPPPPLDHYPICKAHQFDKCMEPGPRVRHKKR